MALLSISTHFLTKDYVEYRKLNDGKKKMDKCKKYLRNVESHAHTNLTPNYAGHIVKIKNMMVSFNMLFRHLYTYRRISMASKFTMALTGAVALFGGLWSGPAFYSNTNVIRMCCTSGTALVIYVFNRTYYTNMYREGDERLNTELKNESDDLWKAEIGMLPDTNPEFD